MKKRSLRQMIKLWMNSLHQEANKIIWETITFLKKTYFRNLLDLPLLRILFAFSSKYFSQETFRTSPMAECKSHRGYQQKGPILDRRDSIQQRRRENSNLISINSNDNS